MDSIRGELTIEDLRDELKIEGYVRNLPLKV